MAGEKTVFVVDDDQDVLLATKLVLEQEGFEVKDFSSSEFISDLDQDPDVILLDILLAGENGIEIARALKNNQKTAHIPIILFSAHYQDLSHALKDIGVHSFISKPFDIDDLIQHVNQAIN
jgi:CheY-like chemotaxis protein